MCVCVCDRESEREERESGRERPSALNTKQRYHGYWQDLITLEVIE